ncbi:hypothetical protein GCM10010420_49700 [Streptomyces glaucosporus]|uniref:RNA polymerase sigma factor 70 region 4 type 2 domain-containing protein n=1 Tax=Streptomyces glaucosporus TaxID=284044 RepID=A0ABN3IUD5_9ACTN
MTETVSIPAPGHSPDPVPEPPSLPDPSAADGPAEAFDLLYERHVTPLLRQAFLLTGDWRTAERSVRHAFRLAWERWPEVAVDRDPAGWVRAAAHEYALAPWHRFLPRRTPRGGAQDVRDSTRDVRDNALDGVRAVVQDAQDAVQEEDRELLEALLELPPSYRRTLLLHDGLGLELPETAAECEASTAATAGRLMHAREALAQYVPELSRVAPGPRREMIRSLLEGLAAARPVPGMPPARAVREGSEYLARCRTGAALALTGLVAAATVLTAVTGPEGYTPRQEAPAVSVHTPDRGAAEDPGADGRTGG